MEKQEALNTIATLSGMLDALNRANKKEAIDTVVSKILDLIDRL